MKRVESGDRRVAVLDALAREREPLATRFRAALLHELKGRTRLLVVEDGDAVVGAAVIRHVGLDRWAAVPFVADPAAAPALGAAIDRSRARSIEGPLEDIELLVPHLRRDHRTEVLPLLVLDALVAAASADQLDRRSRFATPADLPAVVDLYSGYELSAIPTMHHLRRYLAERIDGGNLGIIEERGRIVGAAYCSARTDRYAILTGLTARPEVRGRGVGLAMLPLATTVAKELGIGCLVVWAPTNGIRLKPERIARWTGDGAVAEWARVTLDAPPPRFRGERRLLAALARLQRRVARRPAVIVTPPRIIE